MDQFEVVDWVPVRPGGVTVDVESDEITGLFDTCDCAGVRFACDFDCSDPYCTFCFGFKAFRFAESIEQRLGIMFQRSNVLFRNPVGWNCVEWFRYVSDPLEEWILDIDEFRWCYEEKPIVLARGCLLYTSPSPRDS